LHFELYRSQEKGVAATVVIRTSLKQKNRSFVAAFFIHLMQ
jgi:hypothetical protein